MARPLIKELFLRLPKATLFSAKIDEARAVLGRIRTGDVEAEIQDINASFKATRIERIIQPDQLNKGRVFLVPCKK